MKLSTALLDVLFPPRCPFCHGVVAEDGTICPECQEGLPWLAGNKALRRPDLLEGCASALRYEGGVRKCIHRFKFGRRWGYIRVLGPLVVQCARDHFPQDFDLISWPSLSAKGLRRRGFDQAQLLARAVAEDRGMEATPLFVKKDGVRRQSTIQGAAARRANVLGAFRLTEPERVRGKRVLLVDDVLTSGATLSECARVLLQARAEEVWGVTLASADGRKRS